MLAWGRILALALCSALVLAGCGGGDEIPEESAGDLLQRLDEVEGAVPEGNCEGAQDSADLLREQVGDGEQGVLPGDVDPEVRDLLQQGAERLAQLVSQQCVPEEEPEPEPEVAPEPPAPAEPPPEEPEEPEPEEPEEPEDQDEGSQGRGQGQGGGQGGGDSPGRGQGGGPPTGGADGGTRANG